MNGRAWPSGHNSRGTQMVEKQQKILVVDDSPTVLKIIHEELKGGGYKIIEAADGFEALDKATALPSPDLITLDVDMPKLDGFETCRKLYDEHHIKQFPHLKGGRIPVIFVTANDSIKDRRKGFDLGAADFVAKPFAKGEILDAVNKILKPDERLQGLTVLVVDDSNTARTIVSRSLRSEGMTVIEAKDGLEGFETVCNKMSMIDLVITDLDMPRMDGGELCRKIRNELGLEDLPVIIFTGIADQSQLLDVFKSGATDYLIKPFIKEEMLARVTVQLEKAKLNKRLRSMVNELSESNMIKNSMMSICSHDLRSPLGGILGFADALTEKDYLKPEDMESIALIKDSGELMLALIDDILDLSKVEASDAELEMEPLSFFEVVRKSVNALNHLAENKDQQIKLFNNCPNGVISGEPNAMLRMINNLLSNAIKFTPEKGRIKLEIDPGPQGHLKLTVTDTGIGIPKDKIPHLFDKFTSASQTGTAGEKSTGLGMSIVKEILERHGGSIEVHSVAGKGTTFQIILPESKLPLDQPCQGIKTDAPGQTRSADKVIRDHSVHILLAEDNPTNQKLAKMMLNKQGCRVEVANNGREAVEKYTSAPGNFDLIFMDIEMPEMNGMQATQKIRDQEKAPPVPIIAMTAHTRQGSKDKCLESGMNGYITKPIKKETVFEIIDKWVPGK